MVKVRYDEKRMAVALNVLWAQAHAVGVSCLRLFGSTSVPLPVSYLIVHYSALLALQIVCVAQLETV